MEHVQYSPLSIDSQKMETNTRKSANISKHAFILSSLCLLVAIPVTWYLYNTISPSYLNYDKEASPPHIVFIMSDDVGWADFSLQGGKSLCSTPLIDAIAKESIILGNYRACPACSPSRASFLTGRHSIHTGIYGPLGGVNDISLNLSFPLLPTLLKRLYPQYTAHIVGKWHLGFNTNASLPTSRGFASHFGYYSGAEDHKTHQALYENFERAYDFYENNIPAFIYNGSYSTEVFAMRAGEIISEYSRHSSNRLFLYVAFQDSHWPLQAPEKFDRQMVCAMGAHLDEAVHNITKALKKADIYDNTIFIFSNDNGGAVNATEGSNNINYPLRGGKYTLFEGGVRVLSFIRGPGINTTRNIYEGLFHISDWLPTLLSMVSSYVNVNTPTRSGDLGKNRAVHMDLLLDHEPTFEYGDGVDNWLSISKGQPSARDWVLLEAHPQNDTGSESAPISERNKYFGRRNRDKFAGDALILGDMKIVKSNIFSTTISQINWWPVPPETSNTSSLHGKSLAKLDNLTDCTMKYCLFNLTQDPFEENDISSSYPELVRSLLQKLAVFQSTAIATGEPDPHSCGSPSVVTLPTGEKFYQPCDIMLLHPG